MFRKIFGKKKNTNNTEENIQVTKATINESMHSGIYNLVDHPQEVLLRIHPKKKESYDSIIKGESIVEKNDQQINIEEIILFLNDLNSEEFIKIHYSTINNTVVNHFDEAIPVNGFDINGEPIIYKMKDGTVRIVFAELPKSNSPSFDFDEFSLDLIDSVDCEILHDDREIFHIQKPNKNTVEIINHFLSNYE